MNDWSVLYEDNHLLAVNKPAGMLVQGDRTGDTPLVDHVKAYLKEKYHKPGAVFLGVIHRIDRPVSGVVVLARTSKALERMARQFRERKVQKKYLAVVDGKPNPSEGKLVHWLKKNEATNRTTFFEKETAGALLCQLSYKLQQVAGATSLLEITPITGRSHQIRVQLAALGCPIKGDLKYGGSRGASPSAIALHASAISFAHPTTGEMLTINAPLPESGDWKPFGTAL